jgi:hypothetical protein
MSKKHYETVAGAIWVQVKLGGDSVTLSELAKGLAVAFEAENPRFNADIFFKACGLSMLAESNN